jgi:hypothetical protein
MGCIPWLVTLAQALGPGSIIAVRGSEPSILWALGSEAKGGKNWATIIVGYCRRGPGKNFRAARTFFLLIRFLGCGRYSLTLSREGGVVRMSPENVGWGRCLGSAE